ncbi:MAG: response regulator [Candidatus Thiodiazotropha endolucinida]|uniref:Transcriptional regulatory protein RstA n=2 Tax=Candidatus Thiodiazotropha TaxID=1913444 RepID=A0A7Z0VJS4_9GAMM|nr:response regulator [Candidatus Thiodiazotropha endolucinida]MBT3045076.1 response regulator [Candidatus Thiodiazotropha sp. (ex Codakia orbicularis)]MBV2124223.1 response regulator [Candidatus Thiodiazotropha taylori]MCG7980449.1 response regulator [Candidatus Thiodiazotropha taylori]MCW4238586.1 response regulator [Candidatus Thiodiazotropha endolucinida]ODJ86750.1 transcriptional regulatory protein RstA [Candidatus Thiodiazotropha endolucinida]
MQSNAESGPARVLLVEDDVELAELVQEYLQRYEFEVSLEHRGDTAPDRVRQLNPDILVLDLNLPGRDGLDICRDLRMEFQGPIVMFTARDEDVDEIVGLELGADDYLTKPVEPRVLLARLRSLLRRFKQTGNTTQEDDLLDFGSLRIEASARAVSVNAEEVELSTGEFDLLWLLATQAGKVVDRDSALKTLRGFGYDGLDRSVDIGISRLRRKLGDDANHPYRIKTVRGRGYLFVPDAWD